LTPEEEFEHNRKLFENRCWACNGKLHRFTTPSPGPDFTDCRDYLPSIRVKCESCGAGHKRQRVFVRGGNVPAEEINRLVEQFGWPIPDRELPPLPPPPPPPSLEEIRAKRSQ
jgi:hypothetical protein